MKHLFVLTATIFVLAAACTGSRQATAQQAQQFVDKYGKNEQLADTLLQRLQNENDIVLAACTQNMSWGLHIDYTILTGKAGLWKGYLYSISGTFAKKQTLLTEMPAPNKAAADSMLVLLSNQALWRGRDNHETCNMQVSDGATSVLLMASRGKTLRVSYYMPDSYQKFCPDSTRQLFIDAFGKMKALMNNY
ncbi:MAG TPA: hypothetical protein VHB48_15570 [Chitinophagaceae bacterium]|nr:hypothetical protein [Chitinophagaceae bacterium]